MAHTITNPMIPTITPNMVFVDETLFKLLLGVIVGGTLDDGCIVVGRVLGVVLGEQLGIIDGVLVEGTIDGAALGMYVGLKL